MVPSSTAVVALTALFVAILAYFRWAFGYWKRRNVPYIEPTIPLGTSANPFTTKTFIGRRIQDRYEWFKSRGHKHGGLYFVTSPNYIPIDPEYIKNILSKDFRHFTDRGMYSNERVDPLSAHLFNLEGQKWRSLRAKLTPTFTSGKMKLMFPSLLKCGGQLEAAMDGYAESGAAVDIKEVLRSFTTDVIGSCAFGIECNSFTDPNSEFRRHCNDVFKPSVRTTLAGLVTVFSQRLVNLLKIAVTPKHVTEFFLDIVRKTVEYRERAEAPLRKDFLQILIDLKNSGIGGLTIESMTAQAFVFFLAGFETSSTTMSFSLYELAVNQDIQRKAREEVLRVLESKGGEFSYEAVAEMKYLGQIVDETLRKCPPAMLLPRICVEDYRMPGTDVVIEKGTRIIIPVYGLHHDPEYYPEPEKFIPERFSDENKGTRPPFTYIPFGEGPRICIGVRFGLMQSKLGLAILLKNYEFALDPRMKVPLEFDPKNFILSALGGIWLNVKKINS